MKIEVKRSHRKTMSIIIRDGKVLVRAPHHVSEEQIRHFVLSKNQWIQTKLDEYRPMGYVYGQETLRVFGVEKSVSVVNAKKFVITLEGGDLIISKPQTMSEKRCEELVELHFKNELEIILLKRVEHYAALLKIKTPNFKVRRYKRLYGRCSKDHQLGFNTYLYQDQLPFIDYVVLHECAHILEFNHSRNFYAIIEEHMPNYKEVIAANKT